MADSFRMDMSGEKSYREDALEAAVSTFGERTRSKAVVKACEHARQDRRAKERAVEYLVRNVEPDVAQEVLARLSTPHLPIAAAVEYEDGEGPRVEVELS